MPTDYERCTKDREARIAALIDSVWVGRRTTITQTIGFMDLPVGQYPPL